MAEKTSTCGSVDRQRDNFVESDEMTDLLVVRIAITYPLVTDGYLLV